MSVQIILVRIYFYNELSPFVCKFTSKTVSLLLYPFVNLPPRLSVYFYILLVVILS
jgi:hypothetical protein